MKWPRVVEEGGTALIIALALGAGMAASYGRELEADRKPNRNWWIRRLLIITLLAVAATEATHLFGLTKSGAAFTRNALAEQTSSASSGSGNARSRCFGHCASNQSAVPLWRTEAC
jgi:hypothetical protein